MGGDRFTQISNDLFRDPRLSAKAKGVFGYISTHRDGYGVTIEVITRHMRDGKDAVRGALKELEAYGYLIRERVRDDAGQLREVEYFITDQPALPLDLTDQATPSPAPPGRSDPRPGNPTLDPTSGNTGSRRSEPKSGNPTLDDPALGNPTTKNTNPKNTNQKKIMGMEEEGGTPAHEHDDPARALLADLPDPWALGAVSVDRLTAAAAAALGTGWTPAALTEHLVRNPGGVKNPERVLAARLANLPAPPAARRAAERNADRFVKPTAAPDAAAAQRGAAAVRARLPRPRHTATDRATA
ncbi:MAG TPA: helix-turn-helix domain-containing protein [Streptosporangiaceae bacterium]